MSLKINTSGSLLPLKSVIVNGNFYDALGQVTVTQSWINDGSNTLTATYTFSLDSSAVVNGLKVQIGEKSWVGTVKAKDTAKQEYSQAVEAGLKSSVLQKVSDNDYSVCIGPIEPNDKISIQFTYLARCEVKTGGKYHFTLPTNIAPKYTGSVIDNMTDVQYASAMNRIPYTVNQSMYIFDVNILWNSASGVREVVSPSNNVRTIIETAQSVRVQCTTAPSSGDFTLCMKTGGSTAAYFFRNELSQLSYLYVHNQVPEETVVAARKISILIDRSGSMEGAKIVQARAAVEQFLSLVGAENFINVVSFGSDYKSIFSHPVPATPANVQTCVNLVRGFGADMGGTELLTCLSEVVGNTITAEYEYPSTDLEQCAGLEHIVVLVTDGQVSNIQSILSMLGSKAAAAATRIMTVGIGRDADRKLVEKVAEQTNGVSRMLVDAGDLASTLTDILSFVDKQYFTDVHVQGLESVQCSKVLYPAHPVDMFLELTAEQFREVSAHGLVISANDPVHHTTKSWTIGVDQCVESSDVVMKLCVNDQITGLIKQLEGLSHGNERRTETVSRIVALSVEHGIMNSETSFLVVSDVQASAENVAKMSEYNVPHFSSQNQPYTCFKRNYSCVSGGGGVFSFNGSSGAVGSGGRRGRSVGSVVRSTAGGRGGGRSAVVATSRYPVFTEECGDVDEEEEVEEYGESYAPPPSISKKRGRKLDMTAYSGATRERSRSRSEERGAQLNTSTNTASSKALLALQQADGSLKYSKDSYLLLRYASRSAFDADVMATALSCSLFLNLYALLLLETLLSERGSTRSEVNKLEAFLIAALGEVYEEKRELVRKLM